MQIFQTFTNVIAVDNAIDTIKEMASEIIASCEQDGVASYIMKHI